MNIIPVEVKCKRCGTLTKLPKTETAKRRKWRLCEECFREELFHRQIDSISGLRGPLPFVRLPTPYLDDER